MRARVHLLVLSVALASSVTSLRNGFAYDDVPAIVENETLHSLDSLPRILTSSYWPEVVRDRLFRPATSASFALDWAVGGGRPRAFHVTNVLLHLLVVALVLALAGRVLGGGATVAALWFAVHPVHVEVFANAVGRSELLVAAGYLAATLAYLAEDRAARRSPASGARAGWALLTLLAAAVAFAGKEHALSLPGALLLADAWTALRDGERVLGRIRRRALLWVAVVALAAGYLAARSAAIGTSVGGGAVAAGLGGLSPGGRAVTMAPLVLVWARLLVWPLHLSADYAPEQLRLSPSLSAPLVAAVALGLVVVAGAWALRRRAPALWFGVGWFLGTSAITANVIVPTGVLFAERLLYLPSVGAAIAVGALWQLAAGRRAVWPVTAAVLALLALRTLERVPTWRSTDAVIDALAREATHSYRAHWQLGTRAFDRGDAATGERELLVAARIYPHDSGLLEEIGRRYFLAGFLDAAERYSSAAFAAESTNATAATQVVLARRRLGRPDDAVAFGVEAMRHLPLDPPLLLAVAGAYEEVGSPLRALALARRLLYAYPRQYAYQLVAAAAAAKSGLCDEAHDRLARALAQATLPSAREEIVRQQAIAATCRPRR